MIKRSFEIFKTKGTNVVKSEDFAAILISEGYNVSPNVIKLLFCLIDKNHNGELSLLEMQGFFKAWIEKYEFNIYKTLFSMMDLNNNNVLERNEILKAFKAANFPISDADLRETYGEKEFIAFLNSALA